MANVIYTVPLAIEAQTAVIALVADNLNAVGPANVYIGGGSANYALVTDGAGNLSWANSIAGSGTVTNVNTSGSGLGFTLTGGPITTTGTVTLTVPSSSTLRTNLTIGNVANLNLNSNTTTFLAGNGAWLVPPGTYSNSNVASYLPTYTGNLSPGNVSVSGNLSANNANVTNTLVSNVANVVTLNATGNISANNANITNVLVSNIANVVTLNATGNISANNANISNVLNANVGNFIGNITSLNANLGNLAKASYFQGDGSLLTNLPIPNYANFAGNLINGNTSVRLAANGNVTVNVAGVSNIATFSNTGVNVNGTLSATGNLTVANANLGTLAIANSYVGIMATANQYLISQLGTLTSLDVTGNVAANYYTGNGSLLTGITAINANYANYAGNVTISSQPNITSLGTLTGLNVSGNVSFTGSNVSLGPVNNVHITGGVNGYVLQTDGAGNISWVNGTTTGNGVVGGANRQIQYNNQGNFAGNVGFEFNSTTSNVTVPSFINSTSQNGNAYLTGWSNVKQMGIPSLFIGTYSMNVFGLAGDTVDLTNQTPTTAIANGNTATSIFGSNTFPKPGLVYINTNTIPNEWAVPLIRNTGGNGNLVFANRGGNAIRSFANIGSGGIDAVVSIGSSYISTFPGNVTFFPDNYSRVYSTDSTSSQIYLSTGSRDFTSTNTTTISYAGNYKVTSASMQTVYKADPIGAPNTVNSCDVVVLNQNDFTAVSKWAIIDTTSSTLVNTGNIGNSNSYVNLSYVNSPLGGTSAGVTYTANTGNSLGKYAILTNFANGNAVFTEYSLPTVTPNATNSFCFCLKNIGNSTVNQYIMTCKDEDVANGISNTYTALSSNISANSWTTYISANTPTWFDASNTSANIIVANRLIGINNPGNGAASTYVTSTNGGQNWSSIGTANAALAYIDIIGVTSTANASTPPYSDTYTLITSAIASNTEIGIQSPSNVNANLFTTNATIVFNYPLWISVEGTFITTGAYKSLGSTVTDGSSSKGALWVKVA